VEWTLKGAKMFVAGTSQKAGILESVARVDSDFNYDGQKMERT